MASRRDRRAAEKGGRKTLNDEFAVIGEHENQTFPARGKGRKINLPHQHKAKRCVYASNGALCSLYYI